MYYIIFLVVAILESGSVSLAQNDEQEGDVRLVSAGVLPPNIGMLQIFYNGQWGAVSEHGFDEAEAKVACFQMFGVRTPYIEGGDQGSFWTQHDVPLLFADFDCDGNETRLIDCSFDNNTDMSSFRFVPENTIWISCDVQETFTFDQDEYIFTDYETNPQVTVNRYHILSNDPVSAIDVTLHRVSLENSQPKTQQIDFAVTHSKTSATLDIPLPAVDEPDNPVVYQVTLTDSTNKVALLGEPTMVYIFRNTVVANGTFAVDMISFIAIVSSSLVAFFSFFTYIY